MCWEKRGFQGMMGLTLLPLGGFHTDTVHSGSMVPLYKGVINSWGADRPYGPGSYALLSARKLISAA